MRIINYLLVFSIFAAACYASYHLGYNNGQVDLYCNDPKEDKITKTLIIDLKKIPSYKYIKLLSESDSYAGSMDVELTPKDLWTVGYYYKAYGHEAVQEAIINWKNHPLKREQEGL